MSETTGPLQGRWRALSVCFFAGVAVFIAYIGYSTQVTTIMENLDVNYTQIGSLASITALTGGITLLVVGNWVDSRGPRAGTVAGLLIAGLGQIIFTIAPNYEFLLLSRALMGIGIGLLFVGPYTMVARWFERSGKVAGALGVMGATEGVGTLVATYLLAIVYTSAGYDAGNVVASIIIIGMALVAVVLLKEPPHLERGKLAPPEEGILKQYLKVLSHRNIIAASFVLIGLWGVFSMVVFWVPTLLMEEAGWSAEGAGFMAAVYPLVGTVAAVVAGLISDQLRRRKPLLLLSGLGLALSSIGFALALLAGNYTVLAILLPIAGIFHYTGLPIAFALAFDSVGIRLTATANGFLHGIGCIVGGLVFPLVIGAVRDATGSYNAGFITLAITMFVLNFLIPLVVMKDVTPSKTDRAELASEPTSA